MSDTLLDREAVGGVIAETLLGAGYRRLEERGWANSAARCYEDEFGLVAVVLFETDTDLLANWSDAQDDLVDRLGNWIAAESPKLWDVYMVLVSLAQGFGVLDQIEAIRYDTVRTRKLVAAGGTLAAISDVREFLAPVLPLKVFRPEAIGDPIALLQELLVERGADAEVVGAALNAFLTHQLLLPAIEPLVNRDAD